MQNIFMTNSKPDDFNKPNEKLFPEAPTRCVFRDCLISIKMKKHGFYKRYVISDEFRGYIYLRRYICPCCGRTVSFLPSFLVPYFQYVFPYILSFLCGYFKKEQSLRKYIHDFRRKKDDFSRRHFKYYINRIFLNCSLIQYYLNMTDQGIIPKEDAQDSRSFTKRLLEKSHAVSPHYLSCNFFQAHKQKHFGSYLEDIIRAANCHKYLSNRAYPVPESGVIHYSNRIQICSKRKE